MNQFIRLFTLFLLVNIPSHAQPEPESNFETIIVTATRMPMRANESLSSVIVIDRDEIERSLAADVAELLRFHAGLELGRNGGPGQTTSLFMRGTESNHAIVMIDGIEINPGTIGGAALQNISPHLIDRIEIVKGPRSSLYGSDAIGGVVNIITSNTDGLEVRAGGGRYGTREASLSAGLSTTKTAVSASLSHAGSDGYPTRTDMSTPDRGYDNQSIGLNGTVELAAAAVSFRHWQSSGNTEYLDFMNEPVDQDYLNRASSIVLSSRSDTKWSNTLTLSDITDDIEQRQGPDHARTDRQALDWQNELRLSGRHSLVAGVYLAQEKTRAGSFGTGFDERNDVKALYLEDYIVVGPGQLLLAARYTDHDSFGGNTTWNIEYGHRLPGGWRLTGAAGTGFRAPDATDRFGFGGNPSLQPEASKNLELGADRRFGDAHLLRISAFRNNIKNLIEYVFDPVTFDGNNLNVAKARVTGIDASYRWHNQSWQLGVSALFQDPEDLQTGQRLARRASRSLTVNAVRRFNRHNIGLDLLATSSRRDSAFSDTINAGYVLANVTGQWQVTERWSVQGKIENLLDRDYETAAGFRSPGRGLYLSALYRSQ